MHGRLSFGISVLATKIIDEVPPQNWWLVFSSSHGASSLCVLQQWGLSINTTINQLRIPNAMWTKSQRCWQTDPRDSWSHIHMATEVLDVSIISSFYVNADCNSSLDAVLCQHDNSGRAAPSTQVDNETMERSFQSPCRVAGKRLDRGCQTSTPPHQAELTGSVYAYTIHISEIQPLFTSRTGGKHQWPDDSSAWSTSSDRLSAEEKPYYQYWAATSLWCLGWTSTRGRWIRNAGANLQPLKFSMARAWNGPGIEVPSM